MAQNYVDKIDSKIKGVKDVGDYYARGKSNEGGIRDMWKERIEAYERFYHRPWFGWGDSEADIIRQGRSSRFTVILGATILLCLGSAFWLWFALARKRSKQQWATMRRSYGEQFYLASSSHRQPCGPYSISELQRMKQQGLLTPDSFLWNEHMESWISFRQIQNQTRSQKQ